MDILKSFPQQSYSEALALIVTGSRVRDKRKVFKQRRDAGEISRYPAAHFRWSFKIEGPTTAVADAGLIHYKDRACSKCRLL